MKKAQLLIFGLAGLILTTSGCHYRGAVYSEYNQTALDIRAQQASSSPIQVNFGYDRGVFAYVPKRNASTNSLDGEAVSVIAWNNLQHDVNPFTTSSNTLLQVDAGFISGVAAIVATAPQDAKIVIVPVHDAVFETMASITKNTSVSTKTYQIQTSGNPGKRVSSAMQVFSLPVEQDFSTDDSTDRIEKWLALDDDKPVKTNSLLLDKWMKSHNLNPDHQTMLVYGKQATKARMKAIQDLKIP